MRRRAALISAGALVGVVAMLPFVLAPEPDPAYYVTARVEDTPGRGVTARAEWTDPNGTERARLVQVPAEYRGADHLPLKVSQRTHAAVVEEPPPTGSPMTWLVLSAAAAVGGLFGFVVAESLAGFGFVRGKGEPGTTRVEDLREDRAFYWRF